MHQNGHPLDLKSASQKETKSFQNKQKALSDQKSILNDHMIFDMAGVEGIEPSHDGIKARCLTAWRYPCITTKIENSDYKI